VKAAWFLRSRQLQASLRFWLAITGYNSRDRSFSNRLYFVYLVIFFSLWGLALLALVSSAALQGLQMLSPTNPVFAAAAGLGLLLSGWWFLKLWSAARRSPIRFNEEDAVLVCQTPLPRPAVAAAWFIGDAPVSGIPFWGVAVTLGFALAELSLKRKPEWGDAGLYLEWALRFLLPVLLLHLGMLALVWAFGCLRLQGNRQQRRMNWLPVIFLFLVLTSVLPWFGNWTSASLNPGLILPLLYPVWAGCGLAPYPVGLLVAALWVLGGGAALFAAARPLNLSRVAQETAGSASMTAVSLLGDQKASAAIKLKQRLGGGRSPTRLPGWGGEWALSWKYIMKIPRTITVGMVFDWFILFSLGLGIFLAPDLGSRGMAILFWVGKLGGTVTTELRANLEQWQLNRSLPISPLRAILAVTLPSLALVGTLGLLSLGFGMLLIQNRVILSMGILLPVLLPCLGWVAVGDVLRQVKAEQVLVGTSPAPGIVAMLLSVLLLGINLGLYLLAGDHWTGMVVLFFLDGAAAYGILQICTGIYRGMGK
jgi:hypothetical protein